ncbi:MAG: NAD(P)H-hydrate dehydratase [Actinomycetota bacterium]
MIDVLTASDVRRQDAASGDVSQLMETAGHAVARAVRGMLGFTYGVRVVIVCGTGNNGGDGLVAGRWLYEWGAHVTASLPLGSFKKGSLGEQQLKRFPGVVSSSLSLERADVIIDALFGTGLSRPVSGNAADVIDAINASAAPVVSIDVPSGLDSDTGLAHGSVVNATGIVTLGGLKAGLCFASDAAEWIETADIGVDPATRFATARALESGDVRALMPTRSARAHKRGSGVVLVIAGSRAMPGAAALTSAACVRSGAGLTTLAASERVCSIVLSRLPEITTIPLPESSEGTLDLKGAEPILDRADEFDAIAMGPGLSRHPATIEAVRAIVRETSAPLVLDADGINAFAGSPHLLAEREGFLVATPHEGECARLVDKEPGWIREDRLRAAREAAQAIDHALVLKGPGSIITAPDSDVFINLTGNRGLAQGGTGDVLTGVIASLLAQSGGSDRSDHLTMVAVATWLHGRTADLISERVAPHPANASALIETLPEAIASLFA